MIKTRLTALLLLLLPTWALAFTPVAGRDYRVISNPVPVSTKQGIEVREFFWYGCPHCFHLEPHVKDWLKTSPQGVNFVRTPAALNAVWEANARGFYVAEISGALERSHDALFDAIQVRKQRLFDQKSLARFYARHGIKVETFNSLYSSFAVNAKVAQSQALARRYQLTGVPAMVVNGKYVVSGSDDKAVATVRALVAREQQATAAVTP